MARDNSPAERQRNKLERKQNQRESYARILIVTEGSKTEPNYLSEIRSSYRLHGTNVKVAPSALGTQPIQVVQYAKQLFDKGDPTKLIQIRAFDHVYAVFDRDDHATYHAALSHAESLNQKLRNDENNPVTFKAIASVPSFELWLLLHFEDIQSTLHRDEVLRRLKRHIPDYEKGRKGAFKQTQAFLGTAIERADRLAARFSAYDALEPHTAVVDLVKLLTTLKP